MPVLAAVLTAALLVVAGAILPAPALVGFLRGSTSDANVALLEGARCLKLALVVLGVYIAGLAWYARRYRTLSTGTRASVRVTSGELIVLVLILSAAAAMRLHDLDSGLWWDEIRTYVGYVRIPIGLTLTTFDTQNQHFLYTLCAKLAVTVFGDSVWSLRLPAVVFGIISIAALFVLGWLLRNPREGLLAAALLAVSYHHVWFSQDARGYTMLLTWTLVASCFFVAALERNSRPLWVGYAVAVALGAFTHLTMLFVVGGHFLIYAWTAIRRRELPLATRADGLLFGFGLAGLLTVLFYALVLPQLFAGTLREGTGGAVKSWSSPLWAALEFLTGMGLAYHHVAVFAVVGALVAIGCVGLLRESPMLLALTVLPVAIGVTVVVGSGHTIWPRFLFFASGLAILVLTAGVMAASRWASARIVPSIQPERIATILIAVLVVVSATAVPAAYGPKQDYVGARDFVQSSRRAGDRVVVTGPASWPYQHFYNVDWTAVEDPVDLDRVRDGARRVWLVYTFPIAFDESLSDLSAVVRRDFQVVGRFRGTLNGGDVVVTRSIDVLNGGEG